MNLIIREELRADERVDSEEELFSSSRGHRAKDVEDILLETWEFWSCSPSLLEAPNQSSKITELIVLEVSLDAMSEMLFVRGISLTVSNSLEVFDKESCSGAEQQSAGEVEVESTSSALDFLERSIT
jgi:hypothetical protein